MGQPKSPKKGRLSRALQLSRLAVGAGGRLIAEKARGLGREPTAEPRPSDRQYVEIGAEINVHQMANAYFEGRDIDWPEDPRADGHLDLIQLRPS